MFLSVTRLMRRWYIPRWYFTSPEPWGRGESHPQEQEQLLGCGRRQRSADPKAGRGGHFLEVLPQHSRQEENWHPGKPALDAKSPPTSDTHPAHPSAAEGVGDEASVVGWAKSLNNSFPELYPH